MKKILVSTFLLVASISKADIIKCVFTEPFYSSTYSMTQSTLTFSYWDWDEAVDKTRVFKNVSFQIKAAGVFELVSKEGKVLQTLKLNGQGSDGMSDRVYPYEVEDSGIIYSTNKHFGGCTSNHLKASEND